MNQRGAAPACKAARRGDRAPPARSQQRGSRLHLALQQPDGTDTHRAAACGSTPSRSITRCHPSNAFVATGVVQVCEAEVRGDFKPNFENMGTLTVRAPHRLFFMKADVAKAKQWQTKISEVRPSHTLRPARALRLLALCSACAAACRAPGHGETRRRGVGPSPSRPSHSAPYAPRGARRP